MGEVVLSELRYRSEMTVFQDKSLISGSLAFTGELSERLHYFFLYEVENIKFYYEVFFLLKIFYFYINVCQKFYIIQS